MVETRTWHLAFASLNQFDPHLRDGASWDILTRLQFFQTLGLRVSILSFPTFDQPGKHLTAAMADGGHEATAGEEASGTLFRGVRYIQQILPYKLQEASSYHKPTLKILFSAIRQARIHYLLTADEGYLPLLAGWLLSIPGSHWFFSQDNVKSFVRNVDFLKYLKGRSVFTCSPILQAEIKARMGLEALLWLPSLDFGRYRVGPTKRRTYRMGFCAKGQEQGNALIMEIARRLREREVIVVGQGFLREDRTPNNIVFWGHTPEMKKFYQEIDLLLVPSSADAFPRVVLEAAASGIPVIANRIGGIPEAVGEGGILIDILPGAEGGFDIVPLAAKYVSEIRRFLDDEALYADYSRRALARAARFEEQQAQTARDIYQAHILPFLSSASMK